MTQSIVDKVVEAVLYEGYVLYPYRPSVKNRQRWTFGGLYPRAYTETHKGSDTWRSQTQCLLIGDESTTLRITARFLHLTNRTVARATNNASQIFEPVDSLSIDGHTYQAWQEASERTVELDPTPLSSLLTVPIHHQFAFPPSQWTEQLRDTAGQTVGLLTRDQQAIRGCVKIDAHHLGPDHFRITVRISNETPPPDDNTRMSRDDALLRSLVSTHAILTTAAGQFVSLTDPPAPLRQAAADCQNIGSWPVLVGDTGQTDTLLASPIILYDYPQIAPESPGDLFDATEIDEILSLRIMTLTDDEKRQAAAVDPRVSALLARTESLAREQLMNLHGTVRGLRPVQPEQHHA